MDTLSLGRLRIPLSQGKGGLVVGVVDPALDPLQAIVNSAVTGGKMKGLRNLLEQGLRAESNPAVAIARPYPEDDLAAFQSQWQALTGEPAGDDVYILETLWNKRRVLVPRLALLALLDQLEALRGGPAPPPPEEDLDYIESKAAEADALSGAEAGARVKLLLALLEGHGFLDPKYRDANWKRVRAGHYPVLEGYLRAIDAVESYYRSPQRAEYIQPPDIPPVVGGPVSLEWFRQNVRAPEGMHPLTWLAFCESLLRTASQPPAGNEVYMRVGGQTYHLRFRREDGVHPALIWASPS